MSLNKRETILSEASIAAASENGPHPCPEHRLENARGKPKEGEPEDKTYVFYLETLVRLYKGCGMT
jgi:hypothetical protein